MSKFKKFFIAFAVLYLVWHLGRWYEFERVVSQSVPAWYLTNPVVTDPVVNAVSDLFVTGDWAVGVCLPDLPYGF